ncbi:OsmC family protein [Roseovarius salinarum]|uniref:OsmC family protein n=1 Tax=Roseovarius salinarum TaxID=1981892 RepID=UPI000C33BFD3|nr:OsmC family protein [Roseovarius salinarum]
MKRRGTAEWSGDLRTGTGRVSTESGALRDVAYGFGSRFEDSQGSNPEELIGAAHAGCFSMALSMMLGERQLVPDRIETRADVTLENRDGGFAVTAIHLDVTAKVPDADGGTFQQAAQDAKKGCPISKLVNAEITMDARLE